MEDMTKLLESAEDITQRLIKWYEGDNTPDDYSQALALVDAITVIESLQIRISTLEEAGSDE